MTNSDSQKNVLLESHENYPFIFSRTEELDLSARARNWLYNAGKVYLADILLMHEKDYRRARNIGSKTIAEIKLLLEDFGFTFSMSIPGWPPTAFDEVQMYAAWDNQPKAVELLLDLGADIEAKNHDGVTALMIAAGEGHTETVKLLLDKGADIGVKTDCGVTTLIIAACMGHIETVKLLLNRGADIDAKNDEGWTAQDLAEENGHKAIVKILKKQQDKRRQPWGKR